MFGIKKKDQTKMWQKILGLNVGDKVKVTREFYYFSPKLKKRLKAFGTSGMIKKGTIGKVILKNNPVDPSDRRIYRIVFPEVSVWCTDAHLELIVDEK